MFTVQKARETKHAPETIWEALAAFNNVHVWHPRVQSSPGTSREHFGVGATRTCTFTDGTSFDETVTTMDPGRRLEIELSNFNMPLKQANARIEIVPGLGGSTVYFEMNFEPKYGPMGALWGQLMMKPMMGRLIAQVLTSLDDHLYGVRRVA